MMPRSRVTLRVVLRLMAHTIDRPSTYIGDLREAEDPRPQNAGQSFRSNKVIGVARQLPSAKLRHQFTNGAGRLTAETNLAPAQRSQRSQNLRVLRPLVEVPHRP
jgi:hypothetical protein